MSRISPFHFNINEYSDEEIENICPRYIKWMKKVKAFDFSKRKRGKIDRSVPSFEVKYKLGENSRTPKKSKKGFLSKIRKGGQNLRVRVRTSADLWRRWIRGGIMYNTELDEKDEIEQEQKEIIPPVIIKVEPQPIEEPNPPEVKSSPQILVVSPEEKESKESETKESVETNVSIIESNSVTVNETDVEKSVEIKSENNETNVKTDENEKSVDIQTLNNETETEKTENKVSENINIISEEINETSEPKVKENVVKSDMNSVIANSSSGMPEVVANND